MATMERWTVTVEQYFADHSKISNSMAKVAARSFPEYAGMFVFQTAPREAYERCECSYQVLLGDLVHRMVSDPDWERDILEYTETKGTDTVKYRAFCAEHPGKIVRTPQQLYDAKQMAAALAEAPEARELLSGGMAEVPLTWTCETSGLARKCLVDHLPGSAIADLKTTELPLDDWERQIYKLRYCNQAAWYQHGVYANYGRWLPFKFVVIRSKWPYEFRIVDLSDEYLEIAAQENDAILLGLKDRYARHAQGDASAWHDKHRGTCRTVHPPLFKTQGARSAFDEVRHEY